MKISFGKEPLKSFRLTGRISGEAHRIITLAIQKNEEEMGFAPPIDAAIEALILKVAQSDKDLKRYIEETEHTGRHNGKHEEPKQGRLMSSSVVDLKQPGQAKPTPEILPKQTATA